MNNIPETIKDSYSADDVRVTIMSEQEMQD